MLIHNAVLTGSFSYAGADLSNISASADYSASLSTRTTNLETASGSFSTRLTAVSSSQQQISSSLLQVSASYIALSGSYNIFSGSASTRITTVSSSQQDISSSQQQISASLLNVIATGATTGSNSFRADQSITGSLVVSSTITAQTLVVQTVTSSIVYSSGSNNFGNQLANTQTFTGSVNITGSLALAGNITGNAITLTGALSGTSTSFSGNGLFGGSTNAGNAGTYTLSVGLAGTTAGGIQLWAATNQTHFIQFGDGTASADNYRGYIAYAHGTDSLILGTASTDRLTITSTGAATFSSSVTATQFNVSTSGGATQIYNTGGGHTVIANATANKDMNIQTSGTGGQYFNTAGVDRLIISSTGAATFAAATQDAIQTVVRMSGNNASSQIKALDFKLTAGTPLWTISTAAVGTDAGINIMPNGSAGLSLAHSTGAAVFSSTIAATTATFTTTNTTPLILQTTAGNCGIQILTSATTHNWLVAAQYSAANTFEITPSTAVGGQTYSTPVFKITNGGAATFSSTIDLTGNITTTASSSTAYGIISGIQFKNSSNSGNVKAKIVSINGADSDDMGLSFQTSTNSTNVSEKLRIVGSGAATFSSSLGIGGAFSFNNGSITSSGELSFNSAALNIYTYGRVGLANAGRIIFNNGTGANMFLGELASNVYGFTANAYNSTAVLSMNMSSNAVSVAGALSKGSGTFRIDHPLESKKDTHHLIHSFVEGPRADLIYRGKVTLVNGTATINIDETVGMTEGTFIALNRDIQCFTTNESGWDLVKGKVEGNILTITSQNTESTNEISWMVVGERQDEHIKNTDWTDENGKPILEPLKIT